MSGFTKSEKELTEERHHEETLAEIKRGAAQQAQVTREAAKAQIEAMQESARLQARATESLEQQTREIVEATYDSAALAADQISRAIAEEWVLQAEGKAKRAYELLAGGMTEEAWQLAKEAIQQDPGHLPAYAVAALLHDLQDETVEADRYYSKQINLLRVTPYDQDLRWPIAVLRGLPTRPYLLTDFTECSRVLLTTDRWRWGDWEGFVLLLRERGLHALAKEVAEAALEKQATMKLHAYYLELTSFSDAARLALETYLSTSSFAKQKEFVGEYERLQSEDGLGNQAAQTIYEALLCSQLSALQHEASVADYAFHFDFSQGWKAAQDSFTEYTNVNDVERQNALLGHFADLWRSNPSPSTGLLLMRSILARQFELWQPVRQQFREETASAEARQTVKSVKFLALLMGVSVCLAILGQIMSANSNMVRLFLFLLLVGGLIGTLTLWGLVQDHKERIAERKLQRQLNALWASEREWAEWLGATVSRSTQVIP